MVFAPQRTSARMKKRTEFRKLISQVGPGLQGLLQKIQKVHRFEPSVLVSSISSLRWVRPLRSEKTFSFPQGISCPEQNKDTSEFASRP